MARLDSIIKFNGRLGDYVAYRLNGKWVIRRKGTRSKEQFEKGSNFARTRALNREFAGASYLSKWLRHSLQPWLEEDRDTSLNNRLTRAFLKLIHSGTGQTGRRTFSWKQANEHLQNLVLGKSDPSKRPFSPQPFPRKKADTLEFQSDHAEITAPPGAATHYTITVIALPCPTMRFTEQDQDYRLEESGEMPCIYESTPIPCDHELPSVRLETGKSAPDPHILVFSYRFLQLVADEYLPLRGVYTYIAGIL